MTAEFKKGGVYNILARIGKGMLKRFDSAVVSSIDGDGITVKWQTSRDFRFPNKENLVYKTENIKKADIVSASELN